MMANRTAPRALGLFAFTALLALALAAPATAAATWPTTLVKFK